jgi:adenylate cyclase
MARRWRGWPGFLSRTQARELLVPLAAATVVGLLFFVYPGFLQTLDLKLLDERFHLRGRHATVVPVQIVAIDEASLEKLGRWPWPRTTLARFVSLLSDAGARAIGLDVILADPEQSAEQRVADELLRQYQTLEVAGSDERTPGSSIGARSIGRHPDRPSDDPPERRRAHAPQFRRAGQDLSSPFGGRRPERSGPSREVQR